MKIIHMPNILHKMNFVTYIGYIVIYCNAKKIINSLIQFLPFWNWNSPSFLECVIHGLIPGWVAAWSVFGWSKMVQTNPFIFWKHLFPEKVSSPQLQKLISLELGKVGWLRGVCLGGPNKSLHILKAFAHLA